MRSDLIKWWMAGLIIAFLLPSCVMAVEQAPVMPHVFYGVVYVGENPAPGGVSVEARGTGVLVPALKNPIVTTEGGAYGAAGSFGEKLVVQGDIAQGTAIEFFVNGARAQCSDVAAGTGWSDTYPFKSAEVTQLDLRVSSLPVETSGTTQPTASPTTTDATAVPTTTVTATMTTYIPVGGGGGGGGGGGYTSYSVGSATTAATTTVQTTVGTPVVTEQPTVSIENTTAIPEETIEVTGEPTQEAKTEGAFPIPMNPLTGVIAVMVIIGLMGLKTHRK